MEKVALIGILGVFLAMQFQKNMHQFSLLIGLGISLLIFGFTLERLADVTDFMTQIYKLIPVDRQYIVIVLKLLGISYLSQFSCNICKEAGYPLIAGQIELFAKVFILALSIPSLNYILEILGQLL